MTDRAGARRRPLPTWAGAAPQGRGRGSRAIRDDLQIVGVLNTADPGGVGVDYPVDIVIEFPEDNSFRDGEEVLIRTRYAPDTDGSTKPRITMVNPVNVESHSKCEALLMSRCTTPDMNIDHRADIYAIGAMAYQLLSVFARVTSPSWRRQRNLL